MDRRIVPSVPTSRIEVPAFDNEKLAILVQLGFDLRDDGDVAVFSAGLPHGWTSQGVEGPGDHSEPHGMLCDANGSVRVTLMARERTVNLPHPTEKYGRHVEAYGPSLDIQCRYTACFQRREDDEPHHGRWIVLDHARPPRGAAWHHIIEGDTVDERSRLSVVYMRVCLSQLAFRYPRHLDPLAYWDYDYDDCP